MVDQVDKVLANEENLYKFDEEENDKLFNNKPWAKEEAYFKKVMLSTLAITKIVTHAVRAGDKEIAGYMVGFTKERVFYVVDAVEFPLIGTTSRVEIADQIGDKIHIYTDDILQSLKKVGRMQNYVGWYHSHPKITHPPSIVDLKTQFYQQYQGLFIGLIFSVFSNDKSNLQRANLISFQTNQDINNSYIPVYQKIIFEAIFLFSSAKA